MQTAWTLAAALGQITFENEEPADLIIAGNEATDGRVGAVPAIIAEYLGIPQLTQLRKLTVTDGTVTGERETDEGLFGLEASLPAIVSVTEKINEPRFPSFKGIMAAKKKEVLVYTLADLGVDPETVGVANAGTTVTASTPKPPRTAGERIVDEATAAARSLPTSWARRSSDRAPLQTSRHTQGELDMAEVLVLVEHAEGALKKVSTELITAARALGEPAAVVTGPAGTADKLAEGLAAAGAAKIYVAESDDIDGYLITRRSTYSRRSSSRQLRPR